MEIVRQKNTEDNDNHTSSKCRKRKHQMTEPSATNDIVVHPRYMHFLHMVWFIGRIDHVLRSIVRCWQFKCGSSSMSCSVDSCHKFLDENSSEISQLGIMFTHAIMHVKRSLETLMT